MSKITSSDESMSATTTTTRDTNHKNVNPEKTSIRKNEELKDDKQTDEQIGNENEKRESNDKDNNPENPWTTDTTRWNQVRSSQIYQKGYWAKIKFEIFGYHMKKTRMET